MQDASSEIRWETIERLARRLARGLPAACGVDSFDRIVGISRGGLVPAVLLASELGVKRLETVQVRLYDGATRLAAPELVGGVPARDGPSGDETRTLFVDEMLDSGRTLAFLAERYPRAHLATLVARARGGAPQREHDLLPWSCAAGGCERRVWVAEEVETERWVLFPWSPPEDRAAVASGR